MLWFCNLIKANCTWLLQLQLIYLLSTFHYKVYFCCAVLLPSCCQKKSWLALFSYKVDARVLLVLFCLNCFLSKNISNLVEGVLCVCCSQVSVHLHQETTTCYAHYLLYVLFSKLFSLARLTNSHCICFSILLLVIPLQGAFHLAPKWRKGMSKRETSLCSVDWQCVLLFERGKPILVDSWRLCSLSFNYRTALTYHCYEHNWLNNINEQHTAIEEHPLMRVTFIFKFFS